MKDKSSLKDFVIFEMRSFARRKVASYLFSQAVKKRPQGTATPSASSFSGYAVLRYQRVMTPNSKDPFLPLIDLVSPEEFRAQMLVLKEHFQVMSLLELTGYIYRGEPPPPRSVAVTFDDGWKDIATTVDPIMQELQIPYFVFLAAGYIGERDLYWQQKLYFAAIEFQRRDLPWSFVEGIPESLPAELEQRFPSSPRALQDRALAIVEFFKLLQLERRNDVANNLLAVLESNGGFILPECFMTWPQVRELDQNGVEFGILGYDSLPHIDLDPDGIEQNLFDGVATLQEHNVKDWPIIALPEGIFTSDTQQIYERAGVEMIAGIRGRFRSDTPKNLRFFERMAVSSVRYSTLAEFGASALQLKGFGLSFS